MKIIAYSDLHLEFGGRLAPAPEDTADVMVLAGDIITFRDFAPLARFLQHWKKPVLYVAGNHEYYTKRCQQVIAACEGVIWHQVELWHRGFVATSRFQARRKRRKRRG